MTDKVTDSFFIDCHDCWFCYIVKKHRHAQNRLLFFIHFSGKFFCRFKYILRYLIINLFIRSNPKETVHKLYTAYAVFSDRVDMMRIFLFSLHRSIKFRQKIFCHACFICIPYPPCFFRNKQFRKFNSYPLGTYIFKMVCSLNDSFSCLFLDGKTKLSCKPHCP